MSYHGWTFERWDRRLMVARDPSGRSFSVAEVEGPERGPGTKTAVVNQCGGDPERTHVFGRVGAARAWCERTFAELGGDVGGGHRG